MLDRLLHAGASLALLLTVAWLFSVYRRAIRPRVVLAALALQVGIGALMLFVPAGQKALGAVADVVTAVLSFGDRGTAFLFGGLVEPRMFELFGGSGFILALPVLGLWMLPLGLALLAQDVPGLKVPMEKSARWIEQQWRRWRGK